MNIGCTGTREGLTSAQRLSVMLHVRELSRFGLTPPVLHHGGCVGADRQVHDIFRDEWGVVARIVIHPASDLLRELCDWDDADELKDALPALVRNRSVVEAAFGGLLIACPKGPEVWRSGTWATIRYARRRGCVPLIFWPDGTREGVK